MSTDAHSASYTPAISLRPLLPWLLLASALSTTMMVLGTGRGDRFLPSIAAGLLVALIVGTGLGINAPLWSRSTGASARKDGAVLIREATDDDWAAIWPIFAEVVRAEETYAFDADMPEDVARSLWMERPPGATAVAVDDDDTVLGTAKMGPNRGGRGAHVGTASFMVPASSRGRGVGRALGEHVVAWHREHGFHSIQFNAVVETNTAGNHHASGSASHSPAATCLQNATGSPMKKQA